MCGFGRFLFINFSDGQYHKRLPTSSYLPRAVFHIKESADFFGGFCTSGFETRISDKLNRVVGMQTEMKNINWQSRLPCKLESVRRLLFNRRRCITKNNKYSITFLWAVKLVFLYGNNGRQNVKQNDRALIANQLAYKSPNPKQIRAKDRQS